MKLSREIEGHGLWRAPCWLAGDFGLLHGMGFAGAPAQTGLPREFVPLALMSFNVGIELGQIGVILAVAGLWAVVRKPLARWTERIRVVPVDAPGISSGMWCIDRALVLLE